MIRDTCHTTLILLCNWKQTHAFKKLNYKLYQWLSKNKLLTEAEGFYKCSLDTRQQRGGRTVWLLIEMDFVHGITSSRRLDRTEPWDLRNVAPKSLKVTEKIKLSGFFLSNTGEIP